MKEQILQTLKDLRAYALGKGYEIALFYHEEDSTLMRFANSAISLNTNERLIRLDINAYAGQKRASYELITDLEKVDEMKKGVDTAAEMVKHVQPLTYTPSVPDFGESFSDESGYDPALARLSNEEKLAYFNRAVDGLETDDLRLSGIFSSGENTIAQITTRSEHTQFFRTTDAQVTAVLASAAHKWEMIAEQSAHSAAVLDPAAIHAELAFLLARFQTDPQVQLPLGTYDIVFGPAATADMLTYMNWIGFNGGGMKRGLSFLSEANVGQKAFSDKVTLVDDPTWPETFPFKRDFTGMDRQPFPIFQAGVFQGFTWYQDDADEFGAQATGHTVGHKSLVLKTGEKEINSLEDLVRMPREGDIVYIPYLHYMNIVNPSKGIVTASSRFGALWLRKDGSLAVPYNFRLTQSLLDIFGDKVEWLARKAIVNNTSMSYGARNPTAVIVPQFMMVKDLEISHSNPSF
ncbi:MAG: metallopeptidase TldD-related protein [Chloroflexota bacterium]